MYYLYMLLCGDDTLYTGITTDVARRVREHTEGTGAKYTRARGVKKLLFTERKKNRSTASRREAEIKRMSRSEKLLLAARVKAKLDGAPKKK